MRCKNCGWPNDPNATRCVKCNAPLSGASSMPEVGRQSVYGYQPSENLKTTLRESSTEAQGAQQETERDNSVCPDCGYRRSPSVKICPNCGCKYDKTFIDSVPEPPTQRDSHRGTINPWMQPAEESAFCTLQRIPWQNERVSYDPVSYSGQRIVLNRSNTDSNNNSITSRTQAVLTQEDGKWYIEDGSEMHTTLIRVNRKIELQDGDVVVLGNRMFEFRKG